MDFDVETSPGQSAPDTPSSLAAKAISLGIWAIVSITIAQVVARYILNMSLVWGEELARYAMIAVTFLAPVSMVLRHELTAIGQTFDRIGTHIVLRLALRGIELGFYVTFTISTLRLSQRTAGQHSIALGLPMYIVFSLLTAFGILGALAVLSRALRGKEV
ncbi:MAG: TRAP transporter small permease subunit [Silicimonas sp.]